MRCGADRRLLLVRPCHTSVVRAVTAGFRVWSVQDPALCAPHCLAETERLSQGVQLTDTGDPAALAALLGRTARRHGIAQVLHLDDRRRSLAALAAADPAGPASATPQSVRRISDHTAMRRLLNENGRSPVRARVARSVAEVPALVRTLGLPLVVKRTDAAGTHHVTRITCPGDLAAWTARRAADAAPGPYLLEEYLAGPAFGVHTLTVDGAHHVLAITAHHQADGPVTELYPAPLAPPPGPNSGRRHGRCSTWRITARDPRTPVSCSPRAAPGWSPPRRPSPGAVPKRRARAPMSIPN